MDGHENRSNPSVTYEKHALIKVKAFPMKMEIQKEAGISAFVFNEIDKN